MDQPAQQQTEVERVALRAEAQAYLNQMVRSTNCFDIFCNDMQAAVNELSEHNERRYLEVTLRCDYLQDSMKVATTQSAMFLRLKQDDPERTRNHITMMMEALSELRQHGNKVANWYLGAMVCKNPEPLELERSLDVHMHLLLQDVGRLVSATMSELQSLDVRRVVEEW